MSFSQLRLPGSVIAELYRNTLVDSQEQNHHDKPATDEGKSKTPPLLYLGTNARSIIVLVDYPGEEFLPSAQLQFLTIMLNACNLTLQDVAVINVARQAGIIQELLQSVHPRFMLLFGADPVNLPIFQDMPDLEITETGGISAIKAPSLDQLNQNDKEGRLLKSRLWLCLKQLFKVA
jgi:hypothetical protein